MNVKITPSKLHGELQAISSKSDFHRIAIAALLCRTPVTIGVNSISEDIAATLSCLAALGCTVDSGAAFVKITPPERYNSGALLDCGECGSTARFILPAAAVLCDSFTLDGHGSLRSRPFAQLCSVMRTHGCEISSDTLPITVSGRLESGVYQLRGDISSQYITGLLYALPVLSNDSVIKLTTPLSSAGYVDMTLNTLCSFGISIKTDSENGFPRYNIAGGQRFIPPFRADGKSASDGIPDVSAEGDWSNAAFWICAGALCGGVSIGGLRYESLQRDKSVVGLLRSMGADIVISGERVICGGGTLHGIDIDAGDIPDLVPAISVAAALAEGKTRIYNIGRLRIKESDRVETVCDMLTSLGAQVSSDGESIIIIGRKTLGGGEVDSRGDHRIAMSAAIASCGCTGGVLIKNAGAADKSYPLFFEHFAHMGGKLDVL